ncbi:MAG TPA: SAM-dependent chlorinase/fluorinase [Candidatus Acidoferrales bacterium]|nr:SAM-dependent chlorinase/fluorinase [Candidatus Acidoferrales bacterium]
MASNNKRLHAVVSPVLVLVLCAGCSTHRAEEKRPVSPATIVFMTDFGTANDAVAICKAVMTQIAPDARIMDITHQVTPFSIEEGARFLAGVTPYYPAGTVFLVVVDPGVGTSRKAVIVKTNKGQYFVLPDNGLMTPVIDRDGFAGAREITNPAWMIGDKISSTFHGRDIFSPAAAHLAQGEDWMLAGPEVSELVRLNPRVATLEQKGISGEVVGLDDPFGSLITDIQGDDFKMLGYTLEDKVPVKIDKKQYTFPYEKTFMGVPVGQPLIYIDSRGRLGIAINQGDFSKEFHVTPSAPVFIPRK